MAKATHRAPLHLSERALATIRAALTHLASSLDVDVTHPDLVEALDGESLLSDHQIYILADDFETGAKVTICKQNT